MAPSPPPIGRATYRQVDYWARSGALGEAHVDIGSGYHRKWTEWEMFKLDVIGGIAQDLLKVAGGIRSSFVRRLWNDLDRLDVMYTQVGPVYVRLPSRSDAWESMHQS